MKKIILGFLILSSLALADKHPDKRADLYLKDGKYYSPDINDVFTGTLIYATKPENIDYLEIIYRDGLISEEKELYESGAIKKLTKYDEEEDAYLEEKYYEDGTLSQRKLIKDGQERIVFINDNNIPNDRNYFSFDGRLDKKLEVNGDVRIRYRKEDNFVNDADLYSKFYNDINIKEEKTGNLENFSRKYEYGLLVNESYNKVNEKEKIIKQINFEDNILTVTEDNKETKYYLNGNKKYENITFKDENNILHNETRYFDESEKIISEKIYLNNDLKKEYKDKDYENYMERLNKNLPYTIKYPDGKIAYEKYLTKDNKTIEKYFSKNGTLTFSGEYYPNIYKKSIKKLINEYDDGLEAKVELPKNIKRYTVEGKLIFESKFEENKKFTKFHKISYHKNGKIYYDELETIDNTTDIMVRELKRYDEKGNLEYSLKLDNKIKIESAYRDNKIQYKYELRKEDGDLIEEYSIYYNNGKKRYSDEYHTNYRTGKGFNYIRTYDLDGKMKKESKREYQY